MFVFTGVWKGAHIDDLRRSKDMVSDIKALQNMTISQMFETKTSSSEGNETTLLRYNLSAFKTI